MLQIVTVTCHTRPQYWTAVGYVLQTRTSMSLSNSFDLGSTTSPSRRRSDWLPSRAQSQLAQVTSPSQPRLDSGALVLSELLAQGDIQWSPIVTPQQKQMTTEWLCMFRIKWCWIPSWDFHAFCKVSWIFMISCDQNSTVFYNVSYNALERSCSGKARTSGRRATPRGQTRGTLAKNGGLGAVQYMLSILLPLQGYL